MTSSYSFSALVPKVSFFTGVTVGSSAGLDHVNYDTTPNNGRLDISEEKLVEAAIKNRNVSPPPKANIVIVNQLYPGKKGSITLGETTFNGNVSYVAAKDNAESGQGVIGLTSAHEMGHQLTLSQSPNAKDNEDYKPWPIDINNKHWWGLMKGNENDKKRSTDWLRRVDWKTANEKAKTRSEDNNQ